jgi:hypothetical protein
MKNLNYFLRRARVFFSITLLWCFLLFGCAPSEDFDGNNSLRNGKTVKENIKSRTTNDFYAMLAQRWAPIHYQDVDNSGCGSMTGRGDYITAINFDNDWVSNNNWNNIDRSKGYVPLGHSYYSVVETSTHYFILYCFFHPRDWANVCFFNIDYHENDLEGELTIIKKSNVNGYGELLGMVTVAHSDFYSFVPNGSPLQANQENIDGALSLELFNNELHPVTAQESKGHGLKAWPAYKIKGDGLKYFPSLSVAETPSNNDDRDVKYKLVDIFEANGFWSRRFDPAFLNNAKSFPSTQGSGSANTPWNWDDDDDTPGAGELATDPARLVNFYFKNLGDFNLQYIYNPYQNINTKV